MGANFQGSGPGQADEAGLAGRVGGVTDGTGPGPQTDAVLTAAAPVPATQERQHGVHLEEGIGEVDAEQAVPGGQVLVGDRRFVEDPAVVDQDVQVIVSFLDADVGGLPGLWMADVQMQIGGV